MKKFRTEAHAHVLPASFCSRVEQEDLGRFYAEAGVDTVVLTNHFYMGTLNAQDYIKCYHETKKAAEEHGVTVVLGMEIRFLNDVNPINDYLVYGIDEEDVHKAEKMLNGSFNEFYENFKNDKNIIVQAHPFRSKMVLADLDHLDGIEVFNLHPNHASGVGLAANLAAEHKNFIVTGGTDYHYHGHEGLCTILTDEKINDSFEFANVLKSGLYSFKVGDFEIKKL